MTTPTLRTEKRLLRDGHAVVAGVDEVGRGALAGPVTVGVVLVDAATARIPAGLRDSKLLTPTARDRLAPRIRRWARHWAVGHASAAEIDAHGIIAALRLAGHRALAGLVGEAGRPPDVVILDGRHDWLTPPPQAELFSGSGHPPLPEVAVPLVQTRVKADLTCAAVAAASVLAKTERDAIMTACAAGYPVYGWEGNKGYAAPDHLSALSRWGASELHRRSWRLPGLVLQETMSPVASNQ